MQRRAHHASTPASVSRPLLCLSPQPPWLWSTNSDYRLISPLHAHDLSELEPFLESDGEPSLLSLPACVQKNAERASLRQMTPIIGPHDELPTKIKHCSDVHSSADLDGPTELVVEQQHLNNQVRRIQSINSRTPITKPFVFLVHITRQEGPGDSSQPG